MHSADPAVVLESTTRLFDEFDEHHYTAWYLRRQAIEALLSSKPNDFDEILFEELEFIRKNLQENPKNYQAWFHRQRCLELLGTNSKDIFSIIQGELDSCDLTGHEDQKNYHLWQYRQWLLLAFSDYCTIDTELALTSRIIRKDLLNNSAWNHRAFIFKMHPGLLNLEEERTFVKALLSADPVLNESAQVYLDEFLYTK